MEKKTRKKSETLEKTKKYVKWIVIISVVLFVGSTLLTMFILKSSAPTLIR